MISEAAREPVDIMSDNPFFLLRHFKVAIKAIVQLFPIYRDANHSFRFYFADINYF